MAGGDFARQVEQRLQPEIGVIGNTVALTPESYRKQVFGESAFSAQFRRGPRQQHGLAEAMGRGNQQLPAGRRIDIAAQYVKDKLEFPFPDAKLTDNIRVGLEQARIEFAQRCSGIWTAHASFIQQNCCNSKEH